MQARTRTHARSHMHTHTHQSATFDAFDHDILIRHLQYWLGIKTSILNLLSSFLSIHLQTVIASNSKSQTILLEYGVPQGSVLGSLLYS